jgi:hypothetical protein
VLTCDTAIRRATRVPERSTQRAISCRQLFVGSGKVAATDWWLRLRIRHRRPSVERRLRPARMLRSKASITGVKLACSAAGPESVPRLAAHDGHLGPKASTADAERASAPAFPRELPQVLYNPERTT